MSKYLFMRKVKVYLAAKIGGIFRLFREYL